MAIEKIEGRSDDLLIFENKDGIATKIYPDFFRRAIIISDESIVDYMLVQRSSTLIELYLNGDQERFNNAKNEIELLLQQYLIEGVEIKRTNIHPHEKGNKLRRISYEPN